MTKHTDFARSPQEGSATIFVSSVRKDKGDEHALRWELDLAIRTEDDISPGIAGAKQLRQDARDGHGSAAIKTRPAEAHVKLFVDAEGGEVGFEAERHRAPGRLPRDGQG